MSETISSSAVDLGMSSAVATTSATSRDSDRRAASINETKRQLKFVMKMKKGNTSKTDDAATSAEPASANAALNPLQKKPTLKAALSMAKMGVDVQRRLNDPIIARKEAQEAWAREMDEADAQADGVDPDESTFRRPDGYDPNGSELTPSVTSSMAMAKGNRGPLTGQRIKAMLTRNVATGLALAGYMAAYTYVIFSPYLVAFDYAISFKVEFSTLYAFLYCVDAFECVAALLELRRAIHDAGGCSREALTRASAAKLQPVASAAAVFLLFLPCDAALWGTGKQHTIAYIRFIRTCLPASQRAYAVLTLNERSLWISYTRARVLKMVVLTGWAMHWIACAFFWFGRQDGADHFTRAPWLTHELEEENKPALYLRSAYWSLMTLTTVGHMDVVDRSGRQGGGADWEVVVSMFIIVASIVLFTFVVGNVTSMLMRSDVSTMQYRLKLAGMERYLRRNRVRLELRRRVRSHFVHAFTNAAEAAAVDDGVLGELPSALKVEVLRDMNLRLLRRVPMFFRVDVSLLATVCVMVRRMVFVGDSVILEQGEMATAVNFLNTGTVERMVRYKAEDDDDEDAAEADEPPPLVTTSTISDTGTALGEVGFVFGVRQEATIMASGRVTCLSLSRADLTQLLADFPDSVDAIYSNVLDHLRAQEGDHEATLGTLLENRKTEVTGQLLHAAATGEVDLVRKILRNPGAGVKLHADAADYDMRTPLHVAVSEGHVKMVHVLLKEFSSLGADPVNAVDRWGGTPLQDAIRHGHEGCAVELRKHGATLGYTEVQTSGELCEAARQGHIHTLMRLLENGAMVNAADYDKRTAIHLASSIGNSTAVEYLLEANADINCKDRWNGTPLRDAVTHGHMDLAELLRSRGGELGYDEVQASGELCEMARQGRLDMLKTLVSCGASVNAADYDKRTAIHLASSVGNSTAVEYLLDAKADINCTDRWQGTPLRDAVTHGHMSIAKLLRSRGGELMMDDETLASTLCQLARAAKLETLERYLDAGADANVVDYDGRTVLHLAAASGSVQIVDALLARGAQPRVEDLRGDTPLSLAKRLGHREIVARLNT